METIKTELVSGERRIITKVIDGQRRVSCSCCGDEPEGCCMYPAQALVDGDYDWQDLPDELYAPFENLTYSRVTPYSEGSLTIYYEAPQVAGENQRIFIEHQPSNSIWNSGSLSTAGGPCLVPDQQSPTIEDRFEDTYTTIGYDGVEIVVTRKELCVWEGRVTIPNAFGSGFDLDYTNILAYSGGFGIGPFEYFQPPYELGGLNKWILSVSVGPLGGSSFGIKTGTQNNPIGSYQDPVSQEIFSVSA